MHLRSLALPSLFVLVGGCSAPPGVSQDVVGDGDMNERAGSTSSAIVNGTQAIDYPEAALVEMLHASGEIFAACSASVIAPSVVLTAGHCVDGVSSWQITAPYADGQVANASAGATFDWHEGTADQVNPTHHDIGLVFLDTPIVLAAYPELAKRPLDDGTWVVNIGRILNGVIARHNLYASVPVAVSGGAGVGFPFDYNAKLVIEAGDSGGPVEIPGRDVHLIVAVSSGAGKANEVLARVDLVYGWIQAQIDAHGGGGANGDATLGISAARAPAPVVIDPPDVTGAFAPIVAGRVSPVAAGPRLANAPAEGEGGCAVARAGADGATSGSRFAFVGAAVASIAALRRRRKSGRNGATA